MEPLPQTSQRRGFRRLVWIQTPQKDLRRRLRSFGRGIRMPLIRDRPAQHDKRIDTKAIEGEDEDRHVGAHSHTRKGE